MKVFHSLDQVLQLPQPVILTIGNFDGVHLGHQTILNAVKTKGQKDNLPSAIITFKNHPSTILRPNHPIPLLTSLEHKLKLFEELKIDITIVLNFNLPFSQQSAETFLNSVYHFLPFRELILGYDAKLGNDRQGDTPAIHELARKLHFLLSFLSAEMLNEEPISSSRIRKAVQTADLKEAKQCLGRPYSVVGEVIKGQGEGKRLGYPTANLSMKTLCTPPFGVYTVRLKTSSEEFSGVANIGLAPTVRHDHEPILEVHLLQNHPVLYGKVVEVVFLEFLRPEAIFPSFEHLKDQIAKDINQAKTYFKL